MLYSVTNRFNNRQIGLGTLNKALGVNDKHRKSEFQHTITNVLTEQFSHLLDQRYKTLEANLEKSVNAKNRS